MSSVVSFLGSHFHSVFLGDLPLLVSLLPVCFVLPHFLSLPSPLPVLFVLSVLALTTFGFYRLYRFYRYTVQTVFNKTLPPLFSDNWWISFHAYYLLARPLSTTYRRFTAPFRVLPDVLIVGEVRCGTTTLSGHLTKCFPRACHKPWCPWKHPVLDGKETFYFVGHHEGRVGTKHFPMNFPLVLTRWFHRSILRRPFFTFDACAQYLNSPTAPELVASAYSDRGLEPPMIIACVREPSEQARSWWKYENAAIQWGSSLGLRNHHVDLRSALYPPKSFTSALHYSASPSVSASYAAAGDLVRNKSDEQLRSVRLPPWAVTWPGGQLGGVGRCGAFSANIERWEEAFRRRFDRDRGFGNPLRGQGGNRHNNMVDNSKIDNSVAKKPLAYVTILNLSQQNEPAQLATLLTSVAQKCRVQWNDPQQAEKTKLSIRFYCDNNLGRSSRLNEGVKGGEFEVGDDERKVSADFFRGEKELMKALGGEDAIIGW